MGIPRAQEPWWQVLNTGCWNPLILPRQKSKSIISKTFPKQKKKKDTTKKTKKTTITPQQPCIIKEKNTLEVVN